MFYSPFLYSFYRTLWLVGFFSNIGSWIQTLTASVYITQLTNSSILIGLIQTCAVLPGFIFAIPSGVIADLYDRKFIILCAQIFMLLVAFTMAIISYYGYMNAWLLISTTFLLNAGLALNQPAWQANTTTLIPPTEIKKAAALNNLNYNFSRCIGPAIAGFLYSHLGPVWLFSLNSISFLGIIWVFVMRIPSNPQRRQKLTLNKFKIGFTEGFLLFKTFPTLKFIVSKSFLYFFLSSALWTLLPYIVIIHNKMSAASLGLLTTAAGIGALITPYAIHVLRQRFNDNQLTNVSLVLTSIALFCLAETASFSILFILMALFGYAWSLAISVFNGIIQAEFPENIRSRLIGTYYLFFAGSQALGSYLSAVLVHHLGLNDAFFIISLVATLITLLYLFLPSSLWEESIP